MKNQRETGSYTNQVSDSFAGTDENVSYEISFRRWLVGEIEEKRMTAAQAVERFRFHPEKGYDLIRYRWEKYAPSMVLPLGDMTEAEKQQLTLLQQHNKALEKQLEEAKMKNIALHMLIDVAEEKLNISIRKKSPGKLIHHSDRGIQYCCHDYVSMTGHFAIRLSMTENGDPYEREASLRQ